MDSGGHLYGGQGLRVGGRSCNVSDQGRLTGERSQTFAEDLGDFVFAMGQMSLAVEQSHQYIAQTGECHCVGRLAVCHGPTVLLATSKIQQMQAGTSPSHSGCATAAAAMSTRSAGCPIDAVLVDVQSVEQMGETGVRRRGIGAGRQSSVQIESGLFGGRSSEFTLILQLGAQQRIVTQIHAR